MTKQSIDAYVEAQKNDIIDDLMGLVSYRSIATEPSGVRGALEFVLDRAEEMGFTTMTTAEKDVGIIEMGEGDVTIGILVHVDVVDVGDLEKWVYPPFDCMMSDDQLWGRGTIDDKGPVIMSLYAMKALKDLEIPLNKKIQLIVGTSEEVEWTDMRHFKEQFPHPDYGFTPDGDFPIYNVEKGYADIKLLFSEPKLSRLLELRSGDSPNTIPSKAIIKLQGEEQKAFSGSSAHSSEPEDGDNAIVKMARSIESNSDFNFIRFINDFLADDHNAPALGIDDGIYSACDDPMNATTAVPTILQLKDDGVMLNINIRQKVGVKRQDIENAFSRFSGQYSYSFNVSEAMDGIIVDEKLEPLQRMSLAAQAYEIPHDFMVGRGSSYAKAIPNFVSWGPILPDTENTCHMENERIAIWNVLLATKLYAYWLYSEQK